MIDSIQLKNYKSFKENQILELKPITILIGKNSSGKSALAKLPTLIENSLSEDLEVPLLPINNDVELGTEFRDLVFGKEIGSLEFKLKSGNNTLTVEIASGLKETDLPRIRKWILNDELELTYDDVRKSYLKAGTQEYYKCIFLGFNLELSISDKENQNNIEDNISLSAKGINLITNYIGPFRATPNRTYSSLHNYRSPKIGNMGENAYQILISDYLYNNSTLLNKVSNWYEANFDGWNIEINTQAKPDYKVELSRKNPAFNINLRDVGQGMSQALPLVVSAFIEHKTDILTIIEQPELHLHPGAHGSLAELFVESSKVKTNRFLIETHSQNFVLRIRRLIAEGKFDKDKLALYSVEYDSDTNVSLLKKIEVSELGEVDYWPENVFSETLDETTAIRTAQLNKKANAG
jgi:predicted ATPase